METAIVIAFSLWMLVLLLPEEEKVANNLPQEAETIIVEDNNMNFQHDKQPQREKMIAEKQTDSIHVITHPLAMRHNV